MLKLSIQSKEKALMNKPEKTFVLFSIGANLGDKKSNIEKAISLLSQDDSIIIEKISSYYETEPVGFTEQPWFLNIAVSGFTNLKIEECLKFIKSIEKLIGRQERAKWTEREIDIDLLFYGNEIFECDELTVPHCRLHQRRFVLVPAAEISPDFIHAVFEKSLKQLLSDCSDNSQVRKIDGDL